MYNSDEIYNLIVQASPVLAMCNNIETMVQEILVEKGVLVGFSGESQMVLKRGRR